ncbi:MAG TPA: Ig domain-containing protein [Acidobacteriota bacterium]|nr:Ig domain-containing protein [Acidobacteriota bacterium]
MKHRHALLIFFVLIGCGFLFRTYLPLHPTLAKADPPGVVTRRAPQINGRVEGSVQMLTGENITLNGGSTITGDLLVPGTPTVRRNGNPNLGGVISGNGNPQPTNYQVTLNGNATLGRLVIRTDPFTLSPVAAPPLPVGTRDVTLNNPNDQIGDATTLRNLTLNGNAGTRSVPPGTYGTFTVNGNSALVFGVAGNTQPSLYNLQGLTLNGGAQLQVIGPVILVLRNGTNVNGILGSSSTPLWLSLKIASGGLTVNGGGQVYGSVAAPSGTITLNSRLVGNAACDRLVVNGGGVLQVVMPSTAEIVIQPSTLPDGRVEGNYDQMLTASGGTSPYTFSLTSGGLPTGLTLDSSGRITGVPLQEGSFPLTIMAADANGNTGSQAYTLVIKPACPIIAITPATLADGTIGVAYSQALTAQGGVGNITFSMGSGTLPAGLALAASGVISGTPTASGTFGFGVNATDTQGCTTTQPYQIVIGGGCQLAIGLTSLPNGKVNSPYSQTLTATGGTGTVTFTLSSGSLPAGLNLIETGNVSGIPTASGSSTFSVTATDSQGCGANATYTLVVDPLIAPGTQFLTFNVSPTDFDPDQISISAGKANFYLRNYTGIATSFELVSPTGAITSLPGLMGRNLSPELTLTPGEYTLRDAGNPQVSCRITVTAARKSGRK